MTNSILINSFLIAISILMFSGFLMGLLLAGFEIFKSRSAIRQRNRQNKLSIFNKHTPDNYETYLRYNQQDSDQKILGRDKNVIMVNF